MDDSRFLSSLKALAVKRQSVCIAGDLLIGALSSGVGELVDALALEGVGGRGMKIGAGGRSGAVGVEGERRRRFDAVERVKRYSRRWAEKLPSRGEGGARLRGFLRPRGGQAAGGTKTRGRVVRMGVTGGWGRAEVDMMGVDVASIGGGGLRVCRRGGTNEMRMRKRRVSFDERENDGSCLATNTERKATYRDRRRGRRRTKTVERGW